MKRGYLFLAAILLCTRAQAEETMEGTARIDYFGYSDCILLENESARVVLTGHGGRVLEYSWKGTNGIYLDPAQEGWVWKKGGETLDPTGGRLDIGPETIIPAHPELWMGPWQAEITGPRQARLTSVESAATGVQLVRDFALDERSSHLSCKQTIRNVSDKTRHWGHWSRTFAPGGGIVLIPLSEPHRFPDYYIMYGPGPVMNFHPQDPNIRVRDGFLEVLGTPAHPKLGMDSHAGWFAYLTRDDLLFVKRYPTYPERAYGEMAALTISIWYYKEQMCELEPIGPLEQIAPGQEASFTEDWWLLPHPYPAPGQDVDLEEIAHLVAQQAR